MEIFCVLFEALILELPLILVEASLSKEMIGQPSFQQGLWVEITF